MSSCREMMDIFVQSVKISKYYRINDRLYQCVDVSIVLDEVYE